MSEFIRQHFPLNLPFGFLQLFAGEGDGGGDGGSGGGGDGGAGGQGGDGSGSGTAGKGEKMFTQAELDQHVQARLARAETALAKRLGFKSVEELEAALKKPAGNDQGNNQVDVEKIVQQQLEAKLKEEQERTFKRLLTAEVKVVANELGFADWEDALKLADLSKCKENDKGEIEGVKEALEALAKKKPHLLKQKPGGGKFGADVRNSPDEKKKSLEKIIELAKNRGVATKPENDPWAKK